MSRNFELMQQAAATSPDTTVGSFTELLMPEKRKAKKGKPAVHPKIIGVDQTAREEAVRLVQKVFRTRGQEHRTVVFAAISSGSGCSWICVRTAEILARSISGNVCLVDANFRTPSLPEVLGTSSDHGLSDALRRECPVREFINHLEPANLWLLSCGSAPEASVGLLASERMRTLVSELRKEFEYVLIDAPPIGQYSDTLGIGQLADGLVMILEANVTRKEAAARAVDRLRDMNVNILGAVLNKRTFPIPSSIYQRF
jgi:Mrp family chromosome partitioning ATPase